MDIKAEIEKLVKKITGDSDLLAKFKKSPIDTVKSLLGNVNISSSQLSSIVEGVKAKINVDAIKDKVDTDSVKNVLGGLFGNKG